MISIQKSIGAHRNAIKGLAILWVVYFHALLGLSGFLSEVQKIGYGGVDLFMFLSGFGLFYSLEKDGDICRYFRRRCERLLPSYLPFCLVWLCVMIPFFGVGKATAVRIITGNLFMFGFFADAPVINWYIGVMALTMLLAPLFHAWLKGGSHGLLRGLALVALCFAVGLSYIGKGQYMAFSRLPVFVLGMMFAMPSEKKCRWLPGVMAVGGILGLVIVYTCFARFPVLLGDYAMYWHPFVLIAPAMCAGLGWLFGRLPAWLERVFEALGKASFEIFLFNAWAEILGKSAGIAKTPAQWAMLSAATIVLGLAYHWIVGKIIRKVVDNRR